MIKFLITLTLTAFLIFAVGFWGFDPLPPYFYQTLIFLFVCTAGLYRFLLRTKQLRPDFFVQFYLATMVIKLIAYGIYLFLIATDEKANALKEVGFFMVIYFVFTGLEIGFLFRHVNR